MFSFQVSTDLEVVDFYFNWLYNLQQGYRTKTHYPNRDSLENKRDAISIKLGQHVNWEPKQIKLMELAYSEIDKLIVYSAVGRLFCY